MSSCHGNNETHCCYVAGEVCQFLSENIVPGRRWACSLFVELGDWSLVHQDQRYIERVQPHWITSGTPDCGTWIGPGCCFNTSLDDLQVYETYIEAISRPGTPSVVKDFWGIGE